MSSAGQGSPASTGAAGTADPRRWRGLGVLAAVQFMLVLDIAVVTVALPKMPRLGVRAMLTVGFLGSAAGLLIASFIHVNSGYASAILPGLIVFGVFSGICYPGLINGALHQTTGQDSGLGSGVQTAMQQIGAALGLSTLVTLALRYAGSRISHGVPPAAAQTDGYALAFRAGAALLVVAAVGVLVLLEHVTAKPRTRARRGPGR